MPSYPVRSTRRPRECKTCLPCRASKVRCDRNLPCANCVKRNFTCSYGRPPPNPFSLSTSLPQSAVSTTAASAVSTSGQSPFSSIPYRSTGNFARHVPNDPDSTVATTSPDPLSDNVTVFQSEWDEINSKMSAMEQILSSLNSLLQAHSARKSVETSPGEPSKEENKPTQSEGIYGSNALKTGDVHVGSRSVLVDILDRSRGSEETAQALPKDDLLAELALGNESAAYPFVDLWSPDPFTFNITAVCAVLPDDSQCRMCVSSTDGVSLLTRAGS